MCSKWCNVASRCIWELLEYVPWNIWTWPCLISYCIMISMTSNLTKTKVTLDLLIDINTLLMVEKEIRGRICHVTHRYAKANKKYMKDCYKSKESSYLKYWDVNNLE